MSRIIRPAFWAVFILICALIINRFQPAAVTVLTDGRCLVFWHAQLRCPPCLKLEQAVEESLGNDDRYKLFKLEYDVPANHKLASELNVGTATAVLAEVKDGQIVRQKNLTEPIWKLLDQDNAGLVQMLRKELNDFAN